MVNVDFGLRGGKVQSRTFVLEVYSWIHLGFRVLVFFHIMWNRFVTQADRERTFAMHMDDSV